MNFHVNGFGGVTPVFGYHNSTLQPKNSKPVQGLSTAGSTALKWVSTDPKCWLVPQYQSIQHSTRHATTSPPPQGIASKQSSSTIVIHVQLSFQWTCYPQIRVQLEAQWYCHWLLCFCNECPKVFEYAASANKSSNIALWGIQLTWLSQENAGILVPTVPSNLCTKCLS